MTTWRAMPIITRDYSLQMSNFNRWNPAILKHKFSIKKKKKPKTIVMVSFISCSFTCVELKQVVKNNL